MVTTVLQHQNLPGRGGWSQPRGTRGGSCSGPSWGWLHQGLWGGFFRQSDCSGLEGIFKGLLIQLVLVLEPGQGQVPNLCRKRSWVRQSQGWGLWVKLGLCLLLNPTGTWLRKCLWPPALAACGVGALVPLLAKREQSLDGLGIMEVFRLEKTS